MSYWVLTDPMGSIISQLRTANIASQRIRGNKPAVGDARAAGEYRRFVVIVDLGGPPLHRTPLQTLRYAIRCYGETPQDARDLYGEVFDELDNAGPRYGPTDIALYQTLDDTGGAYNEDPDTKQPYYEGIYVVMAGAQALAS